jgi:ribosomal protein S12 methylthiotransferase accessory factor
MNSYSALKKSLRFISSDAGLLSYIAKLPRSNNDPLLVSYGIWPCDSSEIGGLKYSGRSSGCGYAWEDAVLSTIGEVVERYCPAFYNKGDFRKASFSEMATTCKERVISPSQIALFHPEQYSNKDFIFNRFTNDTVIHWTKCLDLAHGGEVWYPASLIYMPYGEHEDWVGLTTSTGLAGHTNFYKAILNGLYEVIERDNFVMMWMNKIFNDKIEIDSDIELFLHQKFPGTNYDFHFFDISFDLPTPAVFGLCFGKLDFGEFVAVGSASRGPYKGNYGNRTSNSLLPFHAW